MGMFHRQHSGDDMDPDQTENLDNPEETEATEDKVVPWEGMTSAEAGTRADAMRAENMVCAICGEPISGSQRSILARFGFVHSRRRCSSQTKRVSR